MKELGLKAIYPGPKTSEPNKEHKKYPYLLRGLEIKHINQVWSSDIWRTLKYENIFIYDYKTVKDLRKGIERFFKFYNTERFHQSLNDQTPDDIYFQRASSF
jgi:hypothetical protein